MMNATSGESRGAALHATEAPDSSTAHALWAAIEAGDRDSLLTALHAGAYVDARDPAGATALLAACARKGSARLRRQLAEVLLARGADPTRRDGRGRTALHRAARRDDLRLMAMLEAAGADRAAADHKGRLPGDLLKRPPRRFLWDMRRPGTGTSTAAIPRHP